MSMWSLELIEHIKSIKDEDLRSTVQSVIDSMPPLIWIRGASREHHLLDERGEMGNTIHTVRVCRIVDILADVFGLHQLRRDKLKAAAVLHDGGRYGIDGLADHTLREHPYLVRELAEQNDIPMYGCLDVLSMIETHMGRWGDPPYYPPPVDLATLLHVADAIEAHLPDVL